MPYIKQEQRIDIDAVIHQLAPLIKDAGTFNYAVTRLSHLYIKEKGLRYANLNELIGAMECMKLELYRKIAAPYETEKLVENGPVGVLPIELEIEQSIPLDIINTVMPKKGY